MAIDPEGDLDALVPSLRETSVMGIPRARASEGASNDAASIRRAPSRTISSIKEPSRVDPVDYREHRACLPDRRCNVGLLDDLQSITREGTPSRARSTSHEHCSPRRAAASVPEHRDGQTRDSSLSRPTAPAFVEPPDAPCADGGAVAQVLAGGRPGIGSSPSTYWARPKPNDQSSGSFSM